eukprot:15432538-Alexandrium_andersonii.AAC.1
MFGEGSRPSGAAQFKQVQYPARALVGNELGGEAALAPCHPRVRATRRPPGASNPLRRATVAATWRLRSLG